MPRYAAMPPPFPYIIGQDVYYSIGRFYYIIGHLLHYRAFLLHYRALITVSGVYYIIGWYNLPQSLSRGCRRSVAISSSVCISTSLLIAFLAWFHVTDRNDSTAAHKVRLFSSTQSSSCSIRRRPLCEAGRR